MKRKIVDPHVHLFELQKGKYDWLKSTNEPFWPDKSIIHQDFDVDHLLLNDAFELSSFVHIEAGFDNSTPIREVEWLERKMKSQTHESIAFASIAFLDITMECSEFSSQLLCFTQYPSFRGIRFILNEHLFETLNHQNTAKNIAVIEAMGLIFELHYEASNIDNTIHVVKFFEVFPQLKLVLNHVGFMHFGMKKQSYFLSHTDCMERNIEQSLAALATLDNLHIKLSGFEMTNRNYQTEALCELLLHVTKHFELNRVMFASNFPLTLFSKPYQDYWADVLQVCILCELDFHQLTYASAKCFYLIDVENSA
ncbi:amidohydrolase [Glaciecola sp. KUL10]|uniref:amidohydrolase family protein n=1 Tax=Glaciecola sp. (strain KUL10) TaxID=2161813 RepID=UPI000D9977FE|nr:amidohydrolase family protein [Glaciecola sp. KUL10]GBL03111.1 hypothetical protein KUL10_03910 [Glaciecola sp. KUL10]